MSDSPLIDDARVLPHAAQSLWGILGIPAEAPPAEQRRQLLQRLEHGDYLPPPAWHDAIEILARGRAEDPAWLSRPALRREIEDRSRDEIDRLALRFLSMPPSDRQAQWSALRRKCDHCPALRARLALIEPGRSSELGELEVLSDESLACLVRWIMRLFPLDAASRRQAIGEALGTMSDAPDRWEEAGKALAQGMPQIAQLVPEFLAAVASLCDRRREDEVRSVARARNAVEEAEWQSHDPWYYFSSRRWQFVLYGCFAGIPLVLLLLAIFNDYFRKSAPQAPSAARGGASEAEIQRFVRDADAWRRKRASPSAERREKLP